MRYTVIAPVGEDTRALFVGMKEFPTERVILITPSNQIRKAKKLQKKLEEFTVDSHIVEINGNMLEEMFRIFGKVCAQHDEDSIVVNVATGDRMSSCAALSASFANGLRAFGVNGNDVMLLPIMKLSYYNELSESKLGILKELKAEEYTSLRDLSKKLNMSISLLSYHINGNFKYKGLKSFRLVETKDKNKSLYIKLSPMGAMLLKGYIQKK